MYESFLGLHARPFPAAPQVDLYFPARDIEQAHQTLARCIERAEGPGLVVGGAGTGKSLLCQLLAQDLGKRFHLALLTSAHHCTRRALLQNILFELGLPYRGLEEGELRLSLLDFLKADDDSSREGLLLIVDEAHTLPLRLVEEIRMITNFLHRGQPRVRLMLVGSPLLEERLAHPRLESLNQRVAARCYLHPLDYEETVAYIRAQLAAVGGNPDQLFGDEARTAVFQATGGLPRLINQICDHALIHAARVLRDEVDAALVEEAWADLQQLPMIASPAARAGDEAVIEFGALEDESEVYGEAEPPTSAAVVESRDFARQLDTIAEQVAELEADDAPLASSARHAAAATSPPAAGGGFLDPFAEPFAWEEPVVDRYAQLAARAAVTGADPQAAAQAAADRLLIDTLLAPVAPAAEHPSCEDGSPQGPLPASSSGEHASLPQASVVRELPRDDSDLIVVEDGDVAEDREQSRPEGVGRNYRHLFSRLRDGS